ncbi:MAG: hypothetical protein HY606_10925 [Planctomycetes bacterium]|nr:hypothetical protein [Planctomycetota bacterium]
MHWFRNRRNYFIAAIFLISMMLIVLYQFNKTDNFTEKDRSGNSNELTTYLSTKDSSETMQKSETLASTKSIDKEVLQTVNISGKRLNTDISYPLSFYIISSESNSFQLGTVPLSIDKFSVTFNYKRPENRIDYLVVDWMFFPKPDSNEQFHSRKRFRLNSLHENIFIDLDDVPLCTVIFNINKLSNSKDPVTIKAFEAVSGIGPYFANDAYTIIHQVDSGIKYSLPAGIYFTLECRVRGYKPWIQNFIFEAGQTSYIDVNLEIIEKTVKTKTKCIDKNGSPVTDVIIKVKQGEWLSSTGVNEDGWFELEVREGLLADYLRVESMTFLSKQSFVRLSLDNIDPTSVEVLAVDNFFKRLMLTVKLPHDLSGDYSNYNGSWKFVVSSNAGDREYDMQYFMFGSDFINLYFYGIPYGKIKLSLKVYDKSTLEWKSKRTQDFEISASILPELNVDWSDITK